MHNSATYINFASLFEKTPLRGNAFFENASSGCSSVRLEYASGGRGVASSNLVIPTEKGTLIIKLNA